MPNMKSGIAEDAPTVPISDRLLAGWEIASVTVSFLIAEWVVRPFATGSKLIAAVPVSMALVVMLVSHKSRQESRREIGWRLDNFWAAIRLLLLPMGVASLAIALLGFYSNGFKSTKWLEWRWLVWLPVWALIQQYTLQGFINRRFQLILGKGYKSILAVAGVFALLHMPNPFLIGATFLGGILWAAVYQRRPNLIALSISHAFISLLLVFALPSSILSGLRVGFRYFM